MNVKPIRWVPSFPHLSMYVLTYQSRNRRLATWRRTTEWVEIAYLPTYALAHLERSFLAVLYPDTLASFLCFLIVYPVNTQFDGSTSVLFLQGR